MHVSSGHTDYFSKSFSMSLETPNIDDEPFHPSNTFQFPTKLIGDKKRAAVSSWFEKWEWLHYEHNTDNVFCFNCVKAYKQKKLSNSKIEKAFTVECNSVCPLFVKS